MTATVNQRNSVEPEIKTLPIGWIETTLGAIRSDVSKGVLPSDTPQQLFDLYSIPNFPHREPEILTGAAIGSNKQTTSPGTVLLSKINPRINRVWLVRPVDDHPQIASTEWISFGPLQSLNAAYLSFYMQRNQFRDYLAANVSGVGGSLTRTNTAVIDRSSFPLPPLNEQTRIVTKIEELFSKLNAGVAELKRTRVLLKRYRQSVLHAAVTGELSRGWREAQGEELEDAKHLLAHILNERRARWAASGKKGKYAEPQGPDVTGLPKLPSGWVWASVEQLLIAPILNGLSIRGSENPPGTIALRLNAMTESGLDYTKIRYLPVEENEVEDLHVVEGDFFVSRGNGSLRLVGRGTLAQQPKFVCIFPDTMMRLRFIDGLTPWIHSLWASPLIRRQIEAEVKTTAGIWKIAQPQLASIAVPLPPLAEQAYIVTEVERRLSILANMEATVEAELKRAESTRQSILRRAFAGQLVPQDPSDEPGSVLLERIQAERLAAGAAAVRATGKQERRLKTATQVVLLGPGDA